MDMVQFQNGNESKWEWNMLHGNERQWELTVAIFPHPHISVFQLLHRPLQRPLSAFQYS